MNLAPIPVVGEPLNRRMATCIGLTEGYTFDMVGFWQIIVILVIVIIVFGPSRIEKLGPSLGKAIRGFKDGISGKDNDEDENSSEELPPKILTANETKKKIALKEKSKNSKS